MTLEKLENDPKWLLSEYDNMDYFLHDAGLETGALAYVYDKEQEKLIPVKVAHIIRRSDDVAKYDAYDENVLLELFYADYSCELITDNNCYLIWFMDVPSDENMILVNTPLGEIAAVTSADPANPGVIVYLRRGNVELNLAVVECNLDKDKQLVCHTWGEVCCEDPSVETVISDVEEYFRHGIS